MPVEALTALITAAGGALVAFCRWAVRLWATVRREAIEAARQASAQQRADNERMVEALVGQARSNEMLAGKLELVASKLDTISARIEQEDDELLARRARRANGSRAHGAHDDDT